MTKGTRAARRLRLGTLGVALAMSASAVRGQSPLIWREAVSAKLVEDYRYSWFGSLLVQLKTGLLALDPATGKHLWSRPDVTGYEAPKQPLPLVVAYTSLGRTVIDLETGQDRWKLNALGFSAIKNFEYLPSRGLMLVYGETPESPHTIVAAKYESGDVIWRQAGLYSSPALLPKARKVTYGNVLVDTENSVVLDPTDDGLIRLDLHTGRLLWRIQRGDLGGQEDFDELMAADGRIYALFGYGRAAAINAEDGKVLWIRKEKLPTPVFQMLATSQGLLLRGAYNLGQGASNIGDKLWHPYLALLDPATGRAKWTTEKTEFKGRSAFLLEDNAILIAHQTGVNAYDLASGRLLNSFSMAEFSGGEAPCCLQRYDDGRLLVSSSQNIRMFEKSGKPVYSTYFKAPGGSGGFFERLANAPQLRATRALYLAMTGGSLDTLDRAQHATTITVPRFTYIFTEDPDPGTTLARFSLVRIDKATGGEIGRLYFKDRRPSFQLDPENGLVVVLEGDAFYAMRFAPL